MDASRKHHARIHRHRRIRATVSGTATRPRLAVFRSLAHFSAQVIDDVAHKTLVSASDHSLKTGTKSERAAAVGKTIAEQAKAKNISSVVFDRGGSKYHGRIKAFADAARQAGLTF